MTPLSDPLESVALAVAEFREITRSGGATDPFAWRERLGRHHSEFLDLLEMEAALDGILDPPPAEPLPRDFGPYRLLRELGRGGVGVVYEAEHRGSGRRAAVKVLRADFDLDPVARERLRREALSCALIRHDHVVQIQEAGEVGGRAYLAMELVEGRPLSALVAAGEVPAPRELARELGRVADALDELHRVGVVHRDVKPSNLLVDRDGRILLADFGLARTSVGYSLTGSGVAVGTPCYMSPEQLRGRSEEVDGRCDVYALGATLYEALAGRPAFPQEDLTHLWSEILNARPAPLRTVAPTAPAPLEAIAMKALEKRREDRYASAAAMRDDLMAFAEERPVVGRPVGALKRASRALARRWVPLAACLALAAGATAWWFSRPARLLLESVPDDAEVWVAEVLRGRTPVALSLAPGDYDVRVKTEGFSEYRGHVSLSPGGAEPMVVPLQMLDVDDAQALRRVKAYFGVRDVPLTKPEAMRSAGDEGFEGLFPRGDVRLDDLATYGFHVGSRVEGGTLEFRRGSEVLFSAPFDPPRSDMTVAMPATVLAALHPGDVGTWGWRPAKQAGRGDARTVSASFRVVGPEAAAGYASVAERVAGQPAAVAAEVRIGWLRQRGLLVAAARLADAEADATPSSLRLQALAHAIYAELGLAGSPRAGDLQRRIQEFPQEQRDHLYAAAGTAGGGAGVKGK